MSRLLAKWPTVVEPVYKTKQAYQEILEDQVHQLSSLQQLLYADNRYSLLLVFQAMDAAGKDGAIKIDAARRRKLREIRALLSAK